MNNKVSITQYIIREKCEAKNPLDGLNLVIFGLIRVLWGVVKMA